MEESEVKNEMVEIEDDDELTETEDGGANWKDMALIGLVLAGIAVVGVTAYKKIKDKITNGANSKARKKSKFVDVETVDADDETEEEED